MHSFVDAVDCIDCAADASVVGAVNEGIDVAASIIPAVQRPWVMVSVNDDCRDLHFRKAGNDILQWKPSIEIPFMSLQFFCIVLIVIF